MNFSSPYVDLPRRLSVAENLRVYGRLYGVGGLAGRIRELAGELDLQPPFSTGRRASSRPVSAPG